MAGAVLAKRALAEAARVRLRARLDAFSAICVYDLAEHLGIDLRFQALPSLEGMYTPGEPAIVVVSALRPTGRQRINCAHELGHHIFGHGTRLDQLIDNGAQTRFDPDEFLVTCFAEFLLMPKVAVMKALNLRGIDLNSCTPFDVFRVASYFGVGYRTLLHHVENNLREMKPERAAALRKTTPKRIRTDVVGRDIVGELIVADEHWHGRPIDLHVGDVVILPRGVLVEGGRLMPLPALAPGIPYEAIVPGLGRASHETSGWSSYLRVASRVPNGNYAGRSIYRHEEGYDE